MQAKLRDPIANRFAISEIAVTLQALDPIENASPADSIFEPFKPRREGRAFLCLDHVLTVNRSLQYVNHSLHWFSGSMLPRAWATVNRVASSKTLLHFTL